MSEEDIEDLANRSRALIELTSKENLHDDYVTGFIHGMRRAFFTFNAKTGERVTELYHPKIDESIWKSWLTDDTKFQLLVTRCCYSLPVVPLLGIRLKTIDGKVHQLKKWVCSGCGAKVKTVKTVLNP